MDKWNEECGAGLARFGFARDAGANGAHVRLMIVLHELVLEETMVFGGRAKQQAAATDTAPAVQRQQIELQM